MFCSVCEHLAYLHASMIGNLLEKTKIKSKAEPEFLLGHSYSTATIKNQFWLTYLATKWFSKNLFLFDTQYSDYPLKLRKRKLKKWKSEWGIEIRMGYIKINEYEAKHPLRIS